MSNILICEDDAFLAADLSMSVEAAGHNVTGVCANACDALKAASDATPDVAIIDLELADGHTGSGIAQRLTGNGRKGHRPLRPPQCRRWTRHRSTHLRGKAREPRDG